MGTVSGRPTGTGPRAVRPATVHIGRPADAKRKEREATRPFSTFNAIGISPATCTSTELGSPSMEPETPAPRKRATPAAKRTPRTTAKTAEKAVAEKPVKATRTRKKPVEP